MLLEGITMIPGMTPDRIRGRSCLRRLREGEGPVLGIGSIARLGAGNNAAARLSGSRVYDGIVCAGAAPGRAHPLDTLASPTSVQALEVHQSGHEFDQNRIEQLCPQLRRGLWMRTTSIESAHSVQRAAGLSPRCSDPTRRTQDRWYLPPGQRELAALSRPTARVSNGS